MRFGAENVRMHPKTFRGSTGKPIRRLRDLRPRCHGVRLQTLGGTFVEENGQEKTWPALLDTGTPFTVVPRTFVLATRLREVGTARVADFDGVVTDPDRHWYWVRIVLPGVADFIERAIASLDRDPANPRTHITLGRNLLARLTVDWQSSAPWDHGVDIGQSDSWTWHCEPNV